MAEDWAKNVRKYAKDADDAVIAGIVRYCGIALSKKDSALVSFSDPKELARVKAGFMRKKLALAEPEAALDAALAKVADQMKADRTKNRVTVYYLLATEFGKLDQFRAKAKAAAAPAKAEKPAAKAPAKSAAKAATAPASKAAAKATPAKAAPEKAEKETAKPATKATGAKATKAPAKPKVSAAKPKATKSAAAPAPAAPQAVMSAPAPAAAASTAAPAPAAPASAKAPSTATPAASSEESGLGWLPWLLGLILLVFVMWWLRR